MSSQDRLENVLRDIHVMISKSETYDTDRIIVRKQDIFNLIDRLNASVYEIMDEYELTQQSRDRAIREKKKEGDRIIWDASRQAEDIYAASVLYTEEALNHLNVMVDEADATVDRMYREFQKNIKLQQETIRENQLELKSQLQLLADTEKYLRLIEERNREIERERAEKKGRKTLENFGEKHTVIKPEIKINEDYFRKAGIPIEKDEEIQTDEEEMMQPLEDEGVIESTLKKAAEDIQQFFTEDKNSDKNPEKNAKKGGKHSKKQEKSARYEKMAVVQNVADGRQAGPEPVSEAKDSQSAAEPVSAGGDGNQTSLERSVQEGEGSEQVTDNLVQTAAVSDGQTITEQGRIAEETGDRSVKEQDGAVSAVSAAGSTAYAMQEQSGGLSKEAGSQMEIKVNPDPEHSGQKEEETQHGKLSLLDRLMGKKKTLL